MSQTAGPSTARARGAAGRRRKATLEATYRLQGPSSNRSASASCQMKTETNNIPPVQVLRPGPIYAIPSATGRIPPMNAYPLPSPTGNLVPNPLARPIVSSAPPLPELPPSLSIDIPRHPDEQSSPDVGLSEESRAIGELAVTAITYLVQQLLAAHCLIDRIETLRERNRNEITFRIIMQHCNPTLGSLASLMFNDEEKQLIRFSLWETTSPLTFENLATGKLDMFEAYLRSPRLLARALNRNNDVYEPVLGTYLSRAMDACGEDANSQQNKLLHFIDAPSASRIMNSSVLDDFEYEPPGGWIRDDLAGSDAGLLTDSEDEYEENDDDYLYMKSLKPKL
ncbi:hypothetical protein B0T10DRAFT_465448 [Thelonectria olida]|uniref:Uncharacterized protein n=1 Tax=Thelonectria olida TaxID=1576542 RepID=A0A9P9ALQ7_9HYPO|nr:hypothetical protein B0T10DRAFT_465448 [Thelonectria olida]